MRKLMLAVALMLLSPMLIVAQDALNNDSVIKMVKAGLSDDLVIAAVNSKPGTYDTTTDGLAFDRMAVRKMTKAGIR